LHSRSGFWEAATQASERRHRHAGSYEAAAPTACFRAGGVQRNAAPNLFQCHPRNQTVVAVRNGWIWINPYTTLIASFERLIRGREIGTDPLAVAAVVHALPDDVLRHNAGKGHGLTLSVVLPQSPKMAQYLARRLVSW
jgi:hypothetical protein